MAKGFARDLREIGFLWHYPFAQSHQNSPGCNPLRKPCAPPFLVGKGAGGIGFAVGWCGVIRAIP